MDLPRIASHTSLSVPQIETLIHYHPNNNASTSSDDYLPNSSLTKSRTPASKRIQTTALAAAAAPVPGNPEYTVSIPQITILPPGPAHLIPSRKREEALALQNLQKRVQQLKMCKQMDNEPPVLTPTNANSIPQQELDNRPQLLQRILEHKPVSMVLDLEEIQTAWQDSDFITDCLCWHNVYRQRHGVPALTMSPDLCDYAQTWANNLAHTNTFFYRNDKDVGQNLFYRPSNALQSDITGQEVASYWYSAVRQYDYGKEPDVLHANVNAGHFTQLVWASSRYFGVGKARSRSGKVIVVANYFPPGNISGSFQQNVPIPQPDAGSLVLHVPQVVNVVSEYGSDSETVSSASTGTR